MLGVLSGEDALAVLEVDGSITMPTVTCNWAVNMMQREGGKRWNQREKDGRCPAVSAAVDMEDSEQGRELEREQKRERKIEG